MKTTKNNKAADSLEVLYSGGSRLLGYMRIKTGDDIEKVDETTEEPPGLKMKFGKIASK